MRGLVFEGKTWEQYEDLRHSNKVIFKSLQKILKQLLREPDPAQGIGKPEPLSINWQVYGQDALAKKTVLFTNLMSTIFIFLPLAGIMMTIKANH